MTIKEINVSDAYSLYTSEDAIIIDVRECEEFEDFHIKGVHHAALSDLPQSIQKINIPDDKKLIFQCLKGGRSAKAIKYLSENYLKNRDLYNLEGGITAWVNADFPVISHKK